MKPKIIITIDAETGEKASKLQNGFDNFFLGKFNGKEYGVIYIAKLLNEFNIRADFFCNVYEKNKVGEKPIAQIIHKLSELNQSVQLHTHPGFAYDPNRRNLHEYNLEEQIEIINDGAKFIEKGIGEYPNSHRAGMYSADNNTLKALAINNILIDSSFLPDNKNCQLQNLKINEIQSLDKIKEVPITVIKNIDGYKSIPFPKKCWSKIDVNLFHPYFIYYAINHILKKEKYIILFLHSASFIIRNKKNAVTGINYKLIIAFNKLITKLQEDNFQFYTLENFINNEK